MEAHWMADATAWLGDDDETPSELARAEAFLAFYERYVQRVRQVGEQQWVCEWGASQARPQVARGSTRVGALHAARYAFDAMVARNTREEQ